MLRSRIRSHFSGLRGGDQFCLYVYDSYVHQERCILPERPTTRGVNALTALWIRQKVGFRWVDLDIGDLRAAESQLRRDWRPTLNTLHNIP